MHEHRQIVQALSTQEWSLLQKLLASVFTPFCRGILVAVGAVGRAARRLWALGVARGSLVSAGLKAARAAARPFKTLVADVIIRCARPPPPLPRTGFPVLKQRMSEYMCRRSHQSRRRRRRRLPRAPAAAAAVDPPPCRGPSDISQIASVRGESSTSAEHMQGTSACC